MLSTLYEAKQWVDGPDGPVLVRRASWDITQELTRHRDDCRVLVELRRTVGKGMDAERRLSIAQTAACTCGARAESTVEWWKPTVEHKRDNRDPAEVGIEYLTREGAAQWQTNGDSSAMPDSGHPS